MWSLFLYTGKGFDNFITHLPDEYVVFINSPIDEAKDIFSVKIGKSPDEMGFEYIDGSSKEIAWQKALDAKLINLDIELEQALTLDGVKVLEEPDLQVPDVE